MRFFFIGRVNCLSESSNWIVRLRFESDANRNQNYIFEVFAFRMKLSVMKIPGKQWEEPSKGLGRESQAILRFGAGLRVKERLFSAMDASKKSVESRISSCSNANSELECLIFWGERQWSEWVQNCSDWSTNCRNESERELFSWTCLSLPSFSISSFEFGVFRW